MVFNTVRQSSIEQMVYVCVKVVNETIVDLFKGCPCSQYTSSQGLYTSHIPIAHMSFVKAVSYLLSLECTFLSIFTGERLSLLQPYTQGSDGLRKYSHADLSWHRPHPLLIQHHSVP